MHIFRITDGIVTDVADDAIEKVEFISAIVGDRRGNLWLGTVGKGLIRFRDGRFTSGRPCAPATLARIIPRPTGGSRGRVPTA